MGWREGDVIEVGPMTVTVVTVRHGWRGRGYRSVIATADGRPARLGARCTCSGSRYVYTVDLVTETELDICATCRFRKES